MAVNMGKSPSGHGQPDKIRLSDRCGEETGTMVEGHGYDRRGSEGYLGNAGQYQGPLV